MKLPVPHVPHHFVFHHPLAWPPGTWVVRTPIMLASSNFEVSTAGKREGKRLTFVQEIDVAGMDMAKPRLVYVPYNHCAMFIDGTSSVICNQGFHWVPASPSVLSVGLEYIPGIFCSLNPTACPITRFYPTPSSYSRPAQGSKLLGPGPSTRCGTHTLSRPRPWII